jgi:trans-aconitate methyltransferase
MEQKWTKRYFDEIYLRQDPWYFFSSDYEQEKYLRQIRLIKEHLRMPPNEILELGCAEGAHTLLLANKFPDAYITGIDISTHAINKARSNLKSYPQVNLIEADIADSLKVIKTRKFDLIIFSETVYYMGATLSVCQLFTFFTKLVERLTKRGILCMANIIEQKHSEETVLNMRPVMECYYTLLSSLAVPVHRSTYWKIKKESNTIHEYQIWLFQKMDKIDI